MGDFFGAGVGRTQNCQLDSGVAKKERRIMGGGGKWERTKKGLLEKPKYVVLPKRSARCADR